MQLSELFSPALSLTQVEGRSKKRLFETVSQHIAQQNPELEPGQIFDALTERERLGTTGLGEGVAVPHCRLAGANIRGLGVLVQLKSPIDFDAPDQKPVDLLAFLLVPSEATQSHLDALSAIAGKLSSEEKRVALRDADSPDSLYQTLLSD